MENVQKNVHESVQDENKSVQDILDTLGQVKMLDELINSKIAEREQVWDMATKITPNTDGMPHASGVSDKVGNAAVKLMALGAEIDRLVDLYVDHKMFVLAMLEKLPPEEYGVLHRYFIRYMTLGDIAEDMHYSYMQIWRIKNKGLERLKDMM